jgi:hypothetical protein
MIDELQIKTKYELHIKIGLMVEEKKNNIFINMQFGRVFKVTYFQTLKKHRRTFVF